MNNMTGLTAREIAEMLGISYDNVRKRIEKAGIKPITKDAIYPLDTPDKIKDTPPPGWKKGRPRKSEPETPGN